jgi:hypothetical protein
MSIFALRETFRLLMIMTVCLSKQRRRSGTSPLAQGLPTVSSRSIVLALACLLAVACAGVKQAQQQEREDGWKNLPIGHRG